MKAYTGPIQEEFNDRIPITVRESPRCEAILEAQNKRRSEVTI